MSKILLGTIIKAQGIKGEVKVKVFTCDLNRFLHYDHFFIDDKKVDIVKSRIDNSYAYVLFENVSDMNTAETFRNKDIYIDEEDLGELDENEYYIHDLEKASLKFEEGEPFAKIVEVLDQTRNVVIVAKGKNCTYLFPFVEDLILNFNKDEKILTISKKRFNEVRIIED